MALGPHAAAAAVAVLVGGAGVAEAREPFLGDVTQLSVGAAHACAVTSDHAVVCWGDNAAGELGVGTDGRAVAGWLSRPHVVGGLPPIASVAAGAMHTCAVAIDGDVYCWGSAGGDVVGTGGGVAGSIELRGDALGTPVKMPLGDGPAHLVAVASIGDGACAAFADEVRCWTTFGAIPINARTIPAPTLHTVRLADVTALALGHGVACGVSSVGLACWRRDSPATPAVLGRADPFVPVRVAIGQQYACVVSAAGQARCWWSLIDDFWKKAPNRDVRWRGKPATRAIAVGDSPVCTADATGSVDCFLSDEGGLTDDAVAASWATKAIGPHPIGGIADAVDVGLGAGRDAFGYGFGCALRATRDADGSQVACWGDNESGQLGSGDRRSTKAAVRVLGATTAP